MTPLSTKDTRLIHTVAKACMRSNATPTDNDLDFVKYKLLPELDKQGLCFCLNTPMTTQDHMRKADADLTAQLAPGQSTSEVAEKMKEHIQSKFGNTTGLTAGVSPSNVFGFGTALDALTIHGKKVARMGWNGKNMFVYYVPANRYPSVTEIAKKEFGEFTQYNAYFAIKNVDGTVSTWVPSVNDLLQKDWYVVE